jgi:predicted DNA-binding ribbon-helix-helix protein
MVKKSPGQQGHAMDQMSRSITVNARRTSIRMERSIWDALDDISSREGCKVRDLVALVDRSRGENGLTAALRVFVISYFRTILGQAVAPVVAPKTLNSPAINESIRSIT